MRISALTKTVLAAAAALLLYPGAPAQAQFFVGSGNSEIGTIGDPNDSAYRARVSRRYALNYATRGLFGDAESYGSPSSPRPFYFPIPTYSDRGYDFTDKTFDEYLNHVAQSFKLTSSSEYWFRYGIQQANPEQLLFGNALVQRPPLLDRFNQDLQDEQDRITSTYGNLDNLPEAFRNFVIAGYNQFYDGQLAQYEVLAQHELDFLAGGGYLPIPGDPRTPTDPEDPPDIFDPFFPPLPTEDGDGDDTTVDVVDAAALAADIAATLDDPATAQALLEAVAPASASQAAQQVPAVSVVPEPASLALITLGAASFLTRARRR